VGECKECNRELLILNTHGFCNLYCKNQYKKKIEDIESKGSYSPKCESIGCDNQASNKATRNDVSIHLCTNCLLTELPIENNHDTHYRQDIEPIEVIEQVAKNIADKVTPEQLVNITQALKYMLRLGTKDDIAKELDKAQNYLHRASTGKWR